MRYRLRTLLIVLAMGPPLVAGAWFGWRTSHHQPPKFDLSKIDPKHPKLVHMFRLDKDAENAAWEVSKAKSKELGAPQPKPLP